MRAALTGIVGADWVADPDGRLCDCDDATPSCVVRPSDASEVAEVLKMAASESWAVLPVGSGSHLGLGNRPRRGDTWLSTSRLTAISEYEPDDLTAAVGSGCTLGAFNERLSSERQVLPWDPPGGIDRTLGGIVSVGENGPFRQGYGRPRDWVVGIEAATMQGKVIRAGGRVVKNVAGYDLTRLFVASMGTLGVITEINVRVRPKPNAESTTLLTADSTSLWALGRTLTRDYVLPVALELVDAEACEWAGVGEQRQGSMLAVRLAGEEADVVDQTSRLEAMAKDRGVEALERFDGERMDVFWRALADLPCIERASVALRVSVPPSKAEGVAAAAREALSPVAERLGCTAAPELGGLWMLIEAGESKMDQLASVVGELRESCVAEGGSLIIHRAPSELKDRIDAWGPVGTSEPLMRRTKEVFDPDGALNPGRFVAGM